MDSLVFYEVFFFISFNAWVLLCMLSDIHIAVLSICINHFCSIHLSLHIQNIIITARSPASGFYYFYLR